MKHAAIAHLMTAELHRHDFDTRAASEAAHLAVTVYRVAVDRWMAEPARANLPAIYRALARQLLGSHLEGTMNDAIAVAQLVLRERQAADRGRGEQLRAAREPDGHVLTNWIDGTASQYIDGSIALSGAGGAVDPPPEPPVVEVDGDRAIAEAPTTINLRATIGGAQVDLTVRVRLLYRARRHQQTWRLHALTCVYQTDTITPVHPDVPPASPTSTPPPTAAPTNGSPHCSTQQDARLAMTSVATIVPTPLPPPKAPISPGSPAPISDSG